MATTFAMVRLICTYKFSFFKNSILFVLIFTFHLLYSSKKRYYDTILLCIFKIDLLETQAWSQDGQMFQEGHTMLACSRLHRKSLVDKGFFFYLFGKTKIFSRGVPRGQNIPILPAQVAN